MAAEMSAFFASGDTTLYFILNRQSDGYFRNITDTTWEAGLTASWNAEKYGITATEVDSTGRYQADMPSGISAGIYTYILYQRQGGTQATTDYRVSGTGSINWDGTQDVGTQLIYSRLGAPAGGVSISADIANKTGYSLASTGLDAIVIETGMNARQAISLIASASAGVLAGADVFSVTIAAAGVPATNRITATVDEFGNRSAVVINLPA